MVPVFFALITIAAALSIPYFTLYPDHHATYYDFGTDRQREVMRRYRRLAARVPIQRRLGRALASPLRPGLRRRMAAADERREQRLPPEP